jgi:hypothetical protein
MDGPALVPAPLLKPAHGAGFFLGGVTARTAVAWGLFPLRFV